MGKMNLWSSVMNTCLGILGSNPVIRNVIFIVFISE